MGLELYQDKSVFKYLYTLYANLGSSDHLLVLALPQPLAFLI